MIRKLKYILFLGTLLLSAAAFAAPYSLEIIQPQPNLNTKNRFYKAYPGLEYNVRPAVFGGAYPFTYALTNAPAGMTINAHTGEITWPNPVTAGSPHSVTLKVTDSEGAVDTVSWTITVTTKGFGFVDAINGKTVAQGGTGTIDNPWRTMRDWYTSSPSDSTYAGWFIYYRKGTYYTNTCPVSSDGIAIQLEPGKPQVHMGFPGEQAAIHIGGYMLRSGQNDFWLSHLRIQHATGENANGKPNAVRVYGNAHRAMFYKNHFYHITRHDSTSNQSFIMRTSSSTQGNYMAVLDNIFEYTEGSAYALCGYAQKKVVVEGNKLKNFGTAGWTQGIGPKTDNQYWSIRANDMTEMGNGGTGAIWLYGGEIYHDYRDIEVCYNNVRVTSGNALMVGQRDHTWGPVHVYRNTLYGPVRVNNLAVAPGPVYIRDNVIINSESPHIRTVNPTNYTGPKLVVKDNLMGSPSDNIVDADNMLTSAYLKYIGIRGHYIDLQSIPEPPPVAIPSAPILMEVQ